MSNSYSWVPATYDGNGYLLSFAELHFSTLDALTVEIPKLLSSAMAEAPQTPISHLVLEGVPDIISEW